MLISLLLLTIVLIWDNGQDLLGLASFSEFALASFCAGSVSLLGTVPDLGLLLPWLLSVLGSPRLCCSCGGEMLFFAGS